MKRLLLIVSSLLFLSVGCVPPMNLVDFKNYDDVTGLFIYEDVVQLENTGNSPDELFDKLHHWVVLNYVSSNELIQLKDEKNHTLIVKGNFKTNLFGKDGYFPHILELYTKDGRYKYKITVKSYYSFGSGEMSFNSKSMGFKNKIFTDVETRVQRTLLSIKTHVSSSESKKKQDDW